MKEVISLVEEKKNQNQNWTVLIFQAPIHTIQPNTLHVIILGTIQCLLQQGPYCQRTSNLVWEMDVQAITYNVQQNKTCYGNIRWKENRSFTEKDMERSQGGCGIWIGHWKIREDFEKWKGQGRYSGMKRQHEQRPRSLKAHATFKNGTQMGEERGGR